MTGDAGHLLPPDEWKRVQAEAKAAPRRQIKATAWRSAFPSVTSFVQCKYDGGAQPGGKPTFGVLHDAETPLTSGYAASIASYFTRNTNATSAHFMVDPVATVQMLDTSRVAWHCGNGNTRSVGVEQAGYASFTAAQWTTAAGLQQMGRVAALMRDLNAVHGIGLFWMTDQQLRDAWAGRIVGGWATHAQCSRVLGGSTHTDPTPNYPFAQLMTLAQEDDMPTADEVAAAVWNYVIPASKGNAPASMGPAAAAAWVQAAATDARAVQSTVSVGRNYKAAAKADSDDVGGHVYQARQQLDALAAEVAQVSAGAVDPVALATALAANEDFISRLADALVKRNS